MTIEFDARFHALENNIAKYDKNGSVDVDTRMGLHDKVFALQHEANKQIRDVLRALDGVADAPPTGEIIVKALQAEHTGQPGKAVRKTKAKQSGK